MLIADEGNILSETNRQASASVATSRGRSYGSAPQWRSHTVLGNENPCPVVTASVPAGRVRAT